MKLVGLTGGIGTGKSTAAKLFSKRGIPVVDTDDLARELVNPGKPALAEIARFFGTEILDERGELRRGALARIVFSSREKLKQLEAVLHPRIREAWLKECQRWREGESLSSRCCSKRKLNLISNRSFARLAPRRLNWTDYGRAVGAMNRFNSVLLRNGHWRRRWRRPTTCFGPKANCRFWSANSNGCFLKRGYLPGRFQFERPEAASTSVPRIVPPMLVGMAATIPARNPFNTAAPKESPFLRRWIQNTPMPTIRNARGEVRMAAASAVAASGANKSQSTPNTKSPLVGCNQYLRRGGALPVSPLS
jgi:hypothetical protein